MALADIHDDGPRPGRLRAAGRSQDILTTFTRFVAERGYSETNFSDIAEELSISKGTIVHHYGTKDRLFAAMHDAYMRRCLADATQIVASLRGSAEQLAGLLYSFILYQVVDRDATVAFQREIATLATHPATESGRRLRAEYLGLVRQVIETGVAEGVFRSADVEVESLLMFGCSHWAWTWFRPTGRLSALEVGSQLVQLILGGMLRNRRQLAALAEPTGRAARTAEDCLSRSARARGSEQVA
jgi:TetR/AcrR family transcriptional regulator, cholesterol catabolism regulator